MIEIRSSQQTSIFAGCRGGDYRGDGRDTSPQHFGWGDAKVNAPPTDCPKCLLRWRIKGVLYYQNSISFQLQGGYAPLTPWPGALPLDPAGGSAPPPATIQKKSPPLAGWIHAVSHPAAVRWMLSLYITSGIRSPSNQRSLCWPTVFTYIKC